MPRLNLRAVNWAVSWNQTAVPNPTVFITAPRPFRCLQIMPILSKGHFVADLVGIIGSIDIVLGDADR